MIGTWKWNAALGLFAWIVVFVFALPHHTWAAALVRAGYSFLLFFALGYVPRFLLAAIQPGSIQAEVGQADAGRAERVERVESPEEASVPDDGEFQPLVFQDPVRPWSKE